jgi:hypothetical protein
MRMQSSTATCSYGPSQAGYFFDRQRSAARQDHFARARGGSGTLKRRQRDEEDSPVEQPHRAGGMVFDPLTKRFVLERLKRMRVTSPPSSPLEEDSSMDATDAQDKAIIPLPWWQEHGTAAATTTLRPVAGALRALSDAGPFPAGYPMPADDESCTALVVFDPYQARALNASPRIELVESDEEEDAARVQTNSPASDDEPASFVRFEEVADDEDEPMEID